MACMATDKLLRRLSCLGEDQALIKDDAGRNPLHKWAALAKSKSDLEELAKLCPD